MITQRIRLVKDTVYTNILVGNEANLFTNMQLNALTSVPAWVTLNTFPGYILKFNASPTDLGEYYIYLTLGGSPSIEDALLIIEVVDALTDSAETCVTSELFVIDSVTDISGKPRVNLLYDLTPETQPRVGEYIYISGSNYAGYWRVYLSDLTSITLYTAYIGAISGGTYYVESFRLNKTICLVWLTRDGGRCSMVFDQRRDYGLETGDSKTFDNGRAINYTNRGKNFDTKSVYKSGITNDEADLIESLRTSIAVWEYDINLDICTEITLDASSFEKYNTKTRYNEIVIKYKLSNYKTIQSR